MNTFNDYESMGLLRFDNQTPELLEAYTGTSIVSWHGRIERQLIKFLADAEKGRNFTYADKLRQFLEIWRGNEITGSINRETIEILKSAAEMLAVDTWNLSSYFSSLRDQLRVLIASEEELPRGVDTNQNDPFAGTGHGGSVPPMNPSFGPEKEPPAGMGGKPDVGNAGGPAGAAEGPGAKGGASTKPGPEGEEAPLGPEGAPAEKRPQTKRI